ncbi:PhzF family phenazine biosynthesis protein [Streptomyces sp. ODS28]|uniref:PhzF family phenazine biosynthesis protein n=1 Tax=Streptomyces sp. ODS28 TaxID=3136688 RepID=UPI0031EFAC2B
MRIRTVDAFTDRPYAGNPAAVVLFEEPGFPEDARLQRLANELNLSETAYAHPLTGDPDADWALRWFTPQVEVDLCGHATLATAHVLHGDGLASGAVRFRTRSGVLTAQTSENGAITLDFPTAPLTPVEAPAGLTEALGAAPVAVHDTGPLGDLLVELEDEKTVRDLAPDLGAVAALPQRAVLVTARAADPEGPYAYVSRLFGPAVGISEDPVTGSAHTALAPLWSGKLGSDELTGLQVSARTGFVRTTLRGDRTLLTGDAVTVLDAELKAGF